MNRVEESGVGFYDDDPADLGAVGAAAASYDLVLVFAGEPSNLELTLEVV